MALEVRPTLQNMVVFQVVTVALLGGLVFLSVRNPTRYYYSPIYNDHHGEYGGKAMACTDCHSKPFAAVANPDCTNSECHPRYQPEYRGFADAVIYDANWISLQRDAPEKLFDARKENASLIYHHAPSIAALNCTDCHSSHTPPPGGVPLRYDHHGGGYSGDAGCISCHGPEQAPPIVAHEEVLKDGAAIDCFQCHQSGESWTRSVEWAGRPTTSVYEDGLKLIADRSVTYRSLTDAATPAATASTDADLPPISDAPRPASGPVINPFAKPAATPAQSEPATPPIDVPSSTPSPATKNPFAIPSGETPAAAAPAPEMPPVDVPPSTPPPATKNPFAISPDDTPVAAVPAPEMPPVDVPPPTTAAVKNPFALPTDATPTPASTGGSPFADPNDPAPPSTPTPVPTATPLPTPSPTPLPTPRQADYEWDKFWNDYDPATGLYARDGKPVLVFFSHPGVANSRRFEIFAAEMQDVLGAIDEKYYPIRVDMSKHKDVGDSYGVVSAPTLARMRDNATLHSKQLYGGYPTEAELQAFIAAP